MKNDKHNDFCDKDQEIKEQDTNVYFWNALGWQSIPANSKSKHTENTCPYSPGITYSIIDDSIANFCGSGVLQGKRSFKPDEPDAIEGIWYFENCFGEDIATSVDWGSSYFSVLGDTYNPNKWCVEVVIGDNITEIGRYAFYGLTAMRRVTVKGKNTVIIDGEIPSNVIICAQSDSDAKLYAQQNGNPFEELKTTF